jgi:hypothetical protein
MDGESVVEIFKNLLPPGDLAVLAEDIRNLFPPNLLLRAVMFMAVLQSDSVFLMMTIFASG